MLPKMRARALWLRHGVMGLAILVPLVIPVTASASAIPALGHAGTHAQTYVNKAMAISWIISPSHYALTFKLRQSSASRINADELAVALAIGGHDSRAIAIAIQVVVLPKQKLAAVNQYTRAYATSRDCVRCSVLADAYQIIFATDSQPLVTDKQKLGLDLVNTDLEALRNSDLGIDQIQSRLAHLVKQIVSILRDRSYVASVGAAPTDTAPDSHPVIDVYYDDSASLTSSKGG